jgi:predicted nucleic acid-binding protein
MIVADTCLVVHLFNETELTKDAQAILQKEPIWILPKSWREEYANVLSKLARQQNIRMNDVLQHYHSTVLQLHPCEREIDVSKALKVSIKQGISVYDAQFVSFAMDYDTLLVTEDRKIIKKCPEHAVSMAKFLML